MNMNRTDILDTTRQTICHDRQDQYGEAEDNFATIAAFWTTYLRRTVTSYDVAMMMTLLKIARGKANPTHMDNLVDGCGYLALASEMAGDHVA